jgi:tRNA modification GTPase
MRGAEDSIERIGVERAERALAEADLAVLVLDSTRASDEAAWAESVLAGRPAVVAWNKADLVTREDGGEGAGGFGVAGAGDAGGTAVAVATRVRGVLGEVRTVAIRPGGADVLIGALRAALPRVLGDAAGDELPTTSARQEALLTEALAALRRAETSLGADLSYDLIAVDLTDARRALGEMVGRGVGRDVVAEIFSRFCIGK